MAPEKTNRQAFSSALIRWQHQSGRHNLPWQMNGDAYGVWLSEIMLQQTQVTTVISYYGRFLARFPDLESLAAAPVESVLELWAGLGYYARARNLHRCAQVLMSDYGGQFPESADELATLPGIGRSTAAAISVFAFGRRAAILDGNVKRVLARCFGVEGFPGEAAVERALWELAESLLPEKEIRTYTQGLMDLGATVCTRNKPVCPACPMRLQCVAALEGRQAGLPQARPSRVMPERETTWLLILDGRKILLERRPPSGIWGGLLVPPEAPKEQEKLADRLQQLGCAVRDIRALESVRHSFTHFRLTIRPLLCRGRMNAKTISEPGLEWIALDALGSAALPAPALKLLRRLAETEGEAKRGLYPERP